MRLFTWLPITTPPTSEEATAEGFSLLLATKDIGISSGDYMPNEGQFYQHCQRYSAFDDHPVPGLVKEEVINAFLEWEMEAVYPEGNVKAEWGSTVTHWMLIPNAT